MRKFSACIVAGMVALASMSAHAAEVPKIAVAPMATKISAPADHHLKFGKKASKFQSQPQTSAICFTPAGTCWVPGFGFCYCCFGPMGCYNGTT